MRFGFAEADDPSMVCPLEVAANSIWLALGELACGGDGGESTFPLRFAEIVPPGLVPASLPVDGCGSLASPFAEDS